MKNKVIMPVSVLLLILGVIFILFSFKLPGFLKHETEPKYGGTFVFALPDKLETLNPRTVVWFHSKNALSLIYDQLISLNKDLELESRICESWKMSTDGKLFTCQIRKGVFFHNGRELTADDVVFSLNYILSKGALDVGDFKLVEGIEDYWEGKQNWISGINKIDNYNLEIRLMQSWPRFVFALASPRIVVLQLDLANIDERTFFSEPIGTGPFIIKKQTPDELEVEVNQNYFLGRAYLDKIVLRTLAQGEAVDSFKKGVVNDISSYSKNPSLENISHAKRILINSYSIRSLFVNNSKPPFSDIRYRKALFSLINRHKIAQECYFNARVANSIIPKGISGNDEDVYDRYEMYNVDDAKRVLDKLPKYAVTIYDGPNACENEIINNSFALAGLSWKVESVGDNELADMFFSGKLMAHLETDEVKNDDAYTLLKYFESANNENLSRVNDPEIDSLLREALLTDDSLRKSDIYKQIDGIILQKAYALPILYPNNYLITDNRYHGNEYRILTQGIDFTKIWKEKD